MADIRINALATTAASTASDDFVAVDGSANGTRKLNAFSPTFGGNLTVSGTGTSSFSGPLSVTTAAGNSFVRIAAPSGQSPNVQFYKAGAAKMTLGYDLTGAVSRMQLYDDVGGAVRFHVAQSSGDTTVGGNLTVSGTGTSSFGGTVSAAGYGSFGADSGLVDGVLQIKRSTTARTSQIQFQTAGSNDYQLYTSGASSPLYISIAGSATHAFAANGNFLIGKTTPDSGQKLQVSGNLGIGTDQWHFSLQDAKERLFYASNSTTVYRGWGSGVNHEFRTSGDNMILQMDNSQNATFAKNVTIGSGVAASTLTIGTSTSSATVNVVAATDNTARINLDETAGTNGGFWQYVGSTNTIQIGSRVSSTDTVAISFARASANVTVAGNLNITGTQNILGLPATADALGSNSTMTFELTSNTSLTIKVRGTDGNTRSVALTLA